MKKIILIILVLGAIIGGSIGIYLYTKGLPDTQNLDEDFTVSSSELFNEFDQDEQAANTRYLDKIILVQGPVASISSDDKGETSINLETDDDMFRVSCQLLPGEEEKAEKLKPGDQVKVKGKCSGKLMDVILVRSVIVE